MPIRNSLVWICFFIIIVALIHCNQRVQDSYHSFLAEKSFHELSRNEQQQKCKNCHLSEFENEQIGPHAQAFQYLKDHVEFVNSNNYDCGYYTEHVNQSYWLCKSCHAPQNLHETFLFDSLQKPEASLAKLMALRNPRPTPRKDTELKTGIDCMSCHVKGAEIVSLRPVFTKEDSTIESQTREVIVRNNIVCFSCHAEVVRSIEPSIAIHKTGVVRCVNCHQENNTNGKGTHYYFWQHEAAGKTNPKIQKILSDFSYKYDSQKSVVSVAWLNTNIPHLISSGPEMIWVFKLKDSNNAILAEDTLRVNKKAEFDEVMYRNMNNNYHRGVHGIDVPLDGIPIELTIPIKSGKVPKTIEVTFIHKSQYWFPDSLGSILTTITHTL